MKKFAATGLLVVLVVVPGFAQEKKNALSLFVGVNEVLSYGSESDYSLGENDFPVTPAHAGPAAGLAFLHQFSGRLGLEIDGRFALASRITLTDPSDGDTVEADTLQHLTVTANVLWFMGGAGIKPYLALGAGADVLISARDQTLTSSLGYEVSLFAPEKKVEPVGSAGFGVLIELGARLGFRLDFRYVLLPKSSEHPLIHNLNAAAGIAMRLF